MSKYNWLLKDTWLRGVIIASIYSIGAICGVFSPLLYQVYIHIAYRISSEGRKVYSELGNPCESEKDCRSGFCDPCFDGLLNCKPKPTSGRCNLPNSCPNYEITKNEQKVPIVIQNKCIDATKCPTCN